jgi:hypothetical protein
VPEDAPAPTGRILYTDLLQVLLDFQLRGHEKFLMKFSKLFRQCDGDHNGAWWWWWWWWRKEGRNRVERERIENNRRGCITRAVLMLCRWQAC